MLISPENCAVRRTYKLNSLCNILQSAKLDNSPLCLFYQAQSGRFCDICNRHYHGRSGKEKVIQETQEQGGRTSEHEAVQADRAELRAKQSLESGRSRASNV